MANTKNSGSKNSTKNKAASMNQTSTVSEVNTNMESSMKDNHTLDKTSLVNSDESERRDGPGGN